MQFKYPNPNALKTPPCRFGPSVWPPKYEPVLQHTDSQDPSRSRKTRLYQSLDDMQWYLTKHDIADRILFKELTTQICKFPSASLAFVFCMRPKLHLGISNLTTKTASLWRSWNSRDRGIFFGGLSENLPLLFFPFFFLLSFLLFEPAAFRCTWAEVGWRPRRKVRHVRFWACTCRRWDSYLSRWLVQTIGSWVLRASAVCSGIGNTCSSRLSLGITTWIWEVYLFEWSGLEPSGQLLACSMRIGWHLTIPNSRLVLAKPGCWTAILQIALMRESCNALPPAGAFIGGWWRSKLTN